MEKMRKLLCILLSLCSATMACDNRNDSVRGEMGDQNFRTVGPRLSNAKWQACCRKAEIRPSCEESDDPLALLVAADKNCIDTALKLVGTRVAEDLSAAYFIRAQRKYDPVDFLRALQAAEDTLRKNPGSKTAMFNRALAQEKLGLTREAIRSWDEVVKFDESGWSREAREHRERLMGLRDPEWRGDELGEALRRRDRAALTKIARAFPSNAILAFEESDLLDAESSRLFADVLSDPYTQSIVKAAAETKDRAALEQGIRAFRQARTSARNGQPIEKADAYERAATLLERAGNPLSIAARYELAAYEFSSGRDSLPLLDAIAPIAKKHGYRDLSARIQTLRANDLEFHNRYLEAYAAYEQALAFAKQDPTATVTVLTRRSPNYAIVGLPRLAFHDSFAALTLLPRVADVNARHHAYASAATAVRQLDYPEIALQYQNAAVEAIQKAVVSAPAGGLARAKLHLAIALRGRANILVALERDTDARADLEQASDLAEAANRPAFRAQLKMRVKEVSGQASLKNNPKEAVANFSDAIGLATAQDSTYRAVLHYKRAAARRRADDPNADEDIAAALTILREEAANLVESSKRGAYEDLWTPYFSRFEAMHHDMIESRIAEGDNEGAFVYAELARAFEPMQLVLQSRFAPAGFRKIETIDDLRHHLANLPLDTVILQHLVLDEITYTWVLSRDHIELVRQRVGRKKIEGWVSNVNAAVDGKQSSPIIDAMVPAYEDLFRVPLATATARSRTRIVIVPDGPMHGLPFSALRGKKKDDYLIARASIAVAGSTSLYVYALQRDRQFAPTPRPTVLVVGDPALDLRHAREEAAQLERDYGGAEVLLGPNANVQNVLASAKNASIIHFAGHGIVNPDHPSQSKLVLAPHGHESGDLTAEKLMTELWELERTRLVVLGACSSAGGSPVGPEGVAPLVRPLIAANVPAVVGTLWKVDDATVKNLLVSLHCHHRNGDDVAVALQHAQLDMLRTKERNVTVRTWAAFQVIGHAGSPYPHRVTMEKAHSEHVCTQNSLHRPDGLHSQ